MLDNLIFFCISKYIFRINFLSCLDIIFLFRTSFPYKIEYNDVVELSFNYSSIPEFLIPMPLEQKSFFNFSQKQYAIKKMPFFYNRKIAYKKTALLLTFVVLIILVFWKIGYREQCNSHGKNEQV